MLGDRQPNLEIRLCGGGDVFEALMQHVGIVFGAHGLRPIPPDMHVGDVPGPRCGEHFRVFDLHLDAQTLCAALLHDVIEDTPTAKDEILGRFGREEASWRPLGGRGTRRNFWRRAGDSNRLYQRS